VFAKVGGAMFEAMELTSPLFNSIAARMASSNAATSTFPKGGKPPCGPAHGESSDRALSESVTVIEGPL
jgi:hypothetical protein